MARAIKLIDAPVGLFEIDSVLVLKTEYSTEHVDGTITPDCYIVDTGEYFWGGVKTVAERNDLMVTPVDMPTLTPPNEPLTLGQLREMEGGPVWITTPKHRGGIPSRWMLFAGISKSLEQLTVYVFEPASGVGQGYRGSDYGKTWLAYRCPPDGEEGI